MTDADRYHAHGPLQPAAPDPWHDRPCGLGLVPVWFSLMLIVFCVGLAVVS